jgi:hypothetical protein
MMMKMKQKKLTVLMKISIWKVPMEMIVNHNIGKIFKIYFKKQNFFFLNSYSDDDEDITSEEDGDVRVTGILKYFSISFSLFLFCFRTRLIR